MFPLGRLSRLSDNPSWRSADTRHPRYAGVLCQSGDFRLIVVGTGSRYEVQTFRPSVREVFYYTVKHASLLSVLLGRLPVGVVFDNVADLPEKPFDVPRPWAWSSQSLNPPEPLASRPSVAGVPVSALLKPRGWSPAKRAAQEKRSAEKAEAKRVALGLSGGG